MKILLVDDDFQSLDSTRRILEHEGHIVKCVSSGCEALEEMSKEKPELVITDVRMPEMTGMEFVEKFKKMGLNLPFIIMTAFGQVEDAVWAMKMGAVDFLLKPFKRQDLNEAIRQVSGRTNLVPSSGNELIGSSKMMKELIVLIQQLAHTSVSVLISGESGSGKEQVARMIHAHSDRKKEPFIAVNCAAIPENLLESELFGFEKGAFSGASQTKIGLLESANRGTLLLDEIGDMPFALQPKLLRVLEEQKIRRLGSTLERTIDVRILAATHQNLPLLVQAGKFRQDLYYRLDVMTLVVPPLRDRLEDIPELVLYFLKRFSREHQKNILGIDPEAQKNLLKHTWPGNIRELANVIERAVVLTVGNQVRNEDLPVHLKQGLTPLPSLESSSVNIPLGTSLKEMEDLMIQKALIATKGDRAEAAKLLGVNERTIYRRIHKLKEE